MRVLFALMIGLATVLMMTAAPAADAWPPKLIDAVRWEGAPADNDLSQRKTVAIPALPSAPELDGIIDDDAWAHAAQIDGWMRNDSGGPAPVQTTAWLGISGDRLYLAVRAEEPNVEGMVAGVTEDGGRVWSDDCIEVFVDGNLDRRTARQLVINSLGSVTTLARGEDWNPPVARATSVRDDAWYVELSLPIASLGLTGSEFGLNLCRQRRAGGDLQLLAWSPTGGAFLEPGKFGLAALSGGYLRGFVVGAGMLGQNELSVTISNPDAEQRSLSAQLAWWQGDGIALERKVGPFALEPGATREISFGYDIQSLDAPVELEVTVLDENGRRLVRRQTTQQVARVLELGINRNILPQSEREVVVRGVMHLQPRMLERSTLVLALFDDEMRLLARNELSPVDRVMRAQLSLPELEPGRYTLHLVLKHGDGDSSPRLGEDKVELEVTPRAGQ